MSWLVKNRFLFFFAILFLLTGSTYFLIQIARGYRFDPNIGELRPHGLLAVKSKPENAQIYINGILKDVTNTTLALIPGKYQVDVEKEGYHRWSKLLIINKELVTTADTFLFPNTPILEPITFNGLITSSISDDKQKLAFISTDETNQTNLWVYDLGYSLLDFNRSPRLIYEDLSSLIDIDKISLSWSPDSRWITLQSNTNNIPYLVNPNQTNLRTDIKTKTTDYLKYRLSWEKELVIRQKNSYTLLPPKLINLFTNSTDQLSFSPDNTKVLYYATASAILEQGQITPSLVSSTQLETRQLVKDNYYVYDIKEDKNFLFSHFQKPSPTLSSKKPIKTVIPTESLVEPNWLPSSNHLYWTSRNEDKSEIWISEYDNTNKTLIYSGIFDNNFVYPSGNMGKMIILSEAVNEETPEKNLFLLNFSKPAQ